MKSSTYKMLILFGIIILVVISGIIIYNNSDKRKQEVINDKLNEIGEKFYKEFYFDNLNEDLFKIYEDKGIKVSLSDLENYDFLKEYFDNKVFYYNDKECDKNNTMVIIYPKKPYTINDYEIKTVISCGFEEE